MALAWTVDSCVSVLWRALFIPEERLLILWFLTPVPSRWYLFWKAKEKYRTDQKQQQQKKRKTIKAPFFLSLFTIPLDQLQQLGFRFFFCPL